MNYDCLKFSFKNKKINFNILKKNIPLDYQKITKEFSLKYQPINFSLQENNPVFFLKKCCKCKEKK